MARATLLDIAKLNGTDQVVGLIEENLTYAPELQIFMARSIKGTSYKTRVRTGFPSVGFRAANEGVTPSKSSFDQRLVECFILGGRIEVDKAVGQASEEGLAAFEMLEADGVAKQSLIEMGSQIFYGTSADAKGFAGLKSAVAFGADLYVNAAGTTASTASSIYAVKMGLKDVHIVLGNDASFNLTDFRDETIYDDDDRPLPGRVSDLTAWTGLQIGNSKCVGRIGNLTADSGKGATDLLISQLLEKFPVGYKPDFFFMSRRSAGQLQRSRTITINSGPGSAKAAGNVEAVAPLPESAFGIPIITTDSILNTDAIES